MRKKNKNNPNNPRFIEGAIILGISVFLALLLFGALGKSGNTLSTFFLGIFGFTLYGYTCAGFVFSILYFCKLHIRNSKTHIISIVITMTFLILVFHTLSSKSFAADAANYGQYLSMCFYSGKTAGGVLAGLFVYPILKLSYTASIIVFSLAFFAMLFFTLYLEFIKGTGELIPKNKKRTSIKGAKNPQIVDLSNMDDSDANIDEVAGGLYIGTINSKERPLKKSNKKPVNYASINPDNSEEHLNDSLNTSSKDGVSNVLIDKEGRKSKSIDFASNGSVDYAKKGNESLTYEDLTPKNDKTKRAMDILYSSDASIEKKHDKPKNVIKNKEEYSDYTNNRRLERLINNQNRKQTLPLSDNEKPFSNDEDENIFNNIEDSLNNDIALDNFDDIIADMNERTGISNDIEDITGVDNHTKIVDKTCNNSEPLTNFENLKKSFSDDENPFDNDRKFRSDKGGMHATNKSSKLPDYINRFQSKSENKKEEKDVETPTLYVPSRPKTPYIAPPIDILNDYASSSVGRNDIVEVSERLENALEEFDIVTTINGYKIGPTFTRLEVSMPPRVSVKKILTLADDLAMRMEVSKIRIQAPIPGKNAVGIEIPNDQRSIVGIKELIQSPEFNSQKQAISFALGKDIDGRCIVGDLAKMPHLLVAGATGSGKSVGINTLLCSLLYKYSPQDVKLILIDPKRVELNVYSNLPHMLIKDVIFKDDQVLNALDWAIKEMEARYQLFMNNQMQKLSDYNEHAQSKGLPKLPYIVIIIDELAELIMVLKKELEDRIKRLTQLARAAGIHLVVATQRPSVDVITGVIKSNMPSRIAFQVSSGVDSKTILPTVGAEKLLGDGDMLYAPVSQMAPTRLQGAFVSGKEIAAICNFIRDNNDSEFDENVHRAITAVKEKQAELILDEDSNNAASEDPMLYDALKFAIDNGSISISKLQRKFTVGYPRAGKLIDIMEERGFIGKDNGSKPREVFITMDYLQSLYGKDE